MCHAAHVLPVIARARALGVDRRSDFGDARIIAARARPRPRDADHDNGRRDDEKDMSHTSSLLVLASVGLDRSPRSRSSYSSRTSESQAVNAANRLAADLNS
jgi:hypothetical protein